MLHVLRYMYYCTMRIKRQHHQHHHRHRAFAFPSSSSLVMTRLTCIRRIRNNSNNNNNSISTTTTTPTCTTTTTTLLLLLFQNLLFLLLSPAPPPVATAFSFRIAAFPRRPVGTGRTRIREERGPPSISSRAAWTIRKRKIPYHYCGSFSFASTTTTTTTTTLDNSNNNQGGEGGDRGDKAAEAAAAAAAEEDEEDQTHYWDQLYQKGRERRDRITGMMNDNNDTDSVGMMVDNNNNSSNRNSNSNGSVTLSSSSSSSPPPVRVITFDLDNTLWRTGPTISAANDALAAYLKTSSVVQTRRTEDIMRELFAADKAKYCPETMHETMHDGRSPVLLTRLRKDAMMQVLMNDDNRYTEDDALLFVEEAFEKWIEARYNAIPAHYATDVIKTLQKIKQLHIQDNTDDTDNNHNNKVPILIGAITDGNSDPRNIPELNTIFDFCINAEYVGVSKPDKQVYLTAAMEYVIQHVYSSNDVNNNNNNDNDNNNIDIDNMTMEQIEDVIGPWWIHIGDDFTKDIVAAKQLNMRTIWVRELVAIDDTNKKASRETKTAADVTIQDIKNNNNNNNNDDAKTKVKNEDLASQYDKTSPTTTSTGNTDRGRNRKQSSGNDDESSTTTTTKTKTALTPEEELIEFQKKINSQTVVKMAVGADDYLSSTLAREFADATIDNFSDLIPILQDWYNEGTTTVQMDNDNCKEGKEEQKGNSSDEARLRRANPVVDTASDGTSKKAVEEEDDGGVSSLSTETKFCVFCGTKIQHVAVFCSSCGKKQPQL